MNDFRMPRTIDRERARRLPQKAKNVLKTPWTANGKRQPPTVIMEAGLMLDLVDHAQGSRDEFKLLAIRALRRGAQLEESGRRR